MKSELFRQCSNLFINHYFVITLKNPHFQAFCFASIGLQKLELILDLPLQLGTGERSANGTGWETKCDSEKTLTERI